MSLSGALAECAEWAMWEGRDRELTGQALYEWIRAAYPDPRPHMGGEGEPYAQYLIRAFELSGATTQEQRDAHHIALLFARDEGSVCEALRVDADRLKAWVRGDVDARVYRRARALLEADDAGVDAKSSRCGFVWLCAPGERGDEDDAQLSFM